MPQEAPIHQVPADSTVSVPALCVRYLTKRYIGEYSSSGGKFDNTSPKYSCFGITDSFDLKPMFDLHVCERLRSTTKAGPLPNGQE